MPAANTRDGLAIGAAPIEFLTTTCGWRPTVVVTEIDGRSKAENHHKEYPPTALCLAPRLGTGRDCDYLGRRVSGAYCRQAGQGGTGGFVSICRFRPQDGQQVLICLLLRCCQQKVMDPRHLTNRAAPQGAAALANRADLPTAPG